jgi:hypothetical protein
MKLILLALLLTDVVSFASFLSLRTKLLSTENYLTSLFAEVNGAYKTSKKVLVLGGDGFCGWPTSLYLSDQGHSVVIVDNLSRRNIDTELGCDSLTPIQSPEVGCSMCVVCLIFFSLHGVETIIEVFLSGSNT